MPNPYATKSKSGLEMIAYKRLHQKSLGYTDEHDDAHVRSELISAGVSYAFTELLISIGAPVSRKDPSSDWPFEEEAWKPSDDPVDNLATAAAFLSAEIDRLVRQRRNDKVMYIFDKDGTLIKGLENRPANTPAEQVPLPGVVDKIASLRAAGHACYIASNQGGVAWGFISFQEAYALLKDACQKCGIDDGHFLFCPYDSRGEHAEAYAMFAYLRKPKPGMLDLIMKAEPDYYRVVMVGDQDSDREAAHAAGVEFAWASDFFEW